MGIKDCPEQFIAGLWVVLFDLLYRPLQILHLDLYLQMAG